MISRIKTLILTISILAGSCAVAAAAGYEGYYYTQGGYVPISQAWQRVAMVFSSDDYRGLFTGVIALSLFAAGAINYFKIFGGGPKPPATLAWAGPVLIGAAIYIGFFKAPAQLTIYDETIGKGPMVVQGIPEGIARTASMLNNIEGRLVDLISVPSDPGNFRTNNGGLGFGLMREMANIPLDGDAAGSLQKYVDECVVFEMARPGSTMTPDMLFSAPTTGGGGAPTNDAILESLEIAASQSIFTTSSLDDNGDIGNANNDPITCDHAYFKITQYFKPGGMFSQKIADACSGMFIASSDVNQCLQTIESTYAAATGGSAFLPGQFAAEAALSKALLNAFSAAKGSPLAMMKSNQQVATSGVGMGISAGQWIPFAKGVITAIAISFLPVLLIFVATPLYGAAVGTILGFFIWLSMWTLCDAVIHVAIMDYASTYFTQLDGGPRGMDYYMNMPNAATKILSMFGYARSAGLMFATIMTAMITKFGGMALSQLAGNLMGTMQGAGAQGAAAAYDPSAKNQMVSGMIQSTGSLDNRNKFGVGNELTAATAQAGGNINRTLQSVRQAGGSDEYMTQQGTEGAQSTAKSAAYIAQAGGSGASVALSASSGGLAAGGDQTRRNIAEAQGGTSEQVRKASDVGYAQAEGAYRELSKSITKTGGSMEGWLEQNSDSKSFNNAKNVAGYQKEVAQLGGEGAAIARSVDLLSKKMTEDTQMLGGIDKYAKDHGMTREDVVANAAWNQTLKGLGHNQAGGQLDSELAYGAGAGPDRAKYAAGMKMIENGASGTEASNLLFGTGQSTAGTSAAISKMTGGKHDTLPGLKTEMQMDAGGNIAQTRQTGSFVNTDKEALYKQLRESSAYTGAHKGNIEKAISKMQAGKEGALDITSGAAGIEKFSFDGSEVFNTKTDTNDSSMVNNSNKFDNSTGGIDGFKITHQDVAGRSIVLDGEALTVIGGEVTQSTGTFSSSNMRVRDSNNMIREINFSAAGEWGSQNGRPLKVSTIKSSEEGGGSITSNRVGSYVGGTENRDHKLPEGWINTPQRAQNTATAAAKHIEEMIQETAGSKIGGGASIGTPKIFGALGMSVDASYDSTSRSNMIQARMMELIAEKGPAAGADFQAAFQAAREEQALGGTVRKANATAPLPETFINNGKGTGRPMT